MPIYEYKCGKCGAVTEFLESASASGKRGKHLCEKCGSGDMSKQFSGFSVGVANPGSDSKCHGCSDMGCPHSGMN